MWCSLQITTKVWITIEYHRYPQSVHTCYALSEIHFLIPVLQSTGHIWFRLDHLDLPCPCLRVLPFWTRIMTRCPNRPSLRWALSITIWKTSKSWFSKHSWRCRSAWCDSWIFDWISSSVHWVWSRIIRYRIGPERLWIFLDEQVKDFWWSITCVWYFLSLICSYSSKVIAGLHL